MRSPDIFQWHLIQSASPQDLYSSCNQQARPKISAQHSHQIFRALLDARTKVKSIHRQAQTLPWQTHIPTNPIGISSFSRKLIQHHSHPQLTFSAFHSSEASSNPALGGCIICFLDFLCTNKFGTFQTSLW